MKTKVNKHAQAAIREAVENQLRDNDPPQTQQTYQRLLAAGHSIEDAKQMIGAVVASEIFDVLKNQQPFDLNRFVAHLDELPRMPWDENSNPNPSNRGDPNGH